MGKYFFSKQVAAIRAIGGVISVRNASIEPSLSKKRYISFCFVPPNFSSENTSMYSKVGVSTCS